VESFVTGDELVGGRKSWHESSLLQPKDRAEGAREKDALYGSESDETFSKRVRVVDPSKSPVCLLLDARNVIYGMEESRLLNGVLDVCVYQKRVSLGVDVFDGDLETVEATCLRDLNFGHEASGKVLVDDTIRGGEESQDSRDEESLVIVELVVPVNKIW